MPLCFPVHWQARNDLAGIRGEWSRWLTETTQTKADFPGETGKKNSSRVQGVGRVGNGGAWLETATGTTYAVTKYYTLAGQRFGEDLLNAMRKGAAVSKHRTCISKREFEVEGTTSYEGWLLDAQVQKIFRPIYFGKRGGIL